MPRPSIEYMNARRDLKPASGGRDYVKVRNAVDDRAQWESLDTWEKAMTVVDATFAEFRSWVNNLPPIGIPATDLEIPF